MPHSETETDVAPRARLPWGAWVARAIRTDGAHARPLPAVRTRGLSAALVVGAAVLLALVHPTPTASLALPWWALAIPFAAAQVLVFHIEIREEAHTFTFTEIPLVIGLFFCSPVSVIIARIVGEAFVLVVRERQTLVKLAFNLSLFFAESAVAICVFHSLIGGRTVADPVAWLVAVAAIGLSDALSVSAVALVIRWHGGHTDPRRLVATAAATAVTNTSLALVGAVLIDVTLTGGVLVLVLAVVAMVASRGYSALSQRYSSLQMLYDFTRLVSGSLPPDAVIETMLVHTRDLLRARHAEIVLFARDGVPARRMAAAAAPSDEQRILTIDEETLVRWESVRLRIMTEGTALVVPRGSKQPDHQALLTAVGASDLVFAPVLRDAETIGVLVVADRLSDVSTFDHDDGRLFETLSRHASVALENGQLIEKLNDQIRRRAHEARHDPLTGLPNRTAFEEYLVGAIGRSVSGSHVAVLLMDLDGFKDINDTLGHHCGDQVLQVVARRLGEAIDAGGSVARLGGDEFAVVLPRVADAAGALALADHIHTLLDRPTTVEGVTVDVRASIGVALHPIHGDDASTLLQRADVAMYSTKASEDRRPRCYSPEHDSNNRRRLSLVGALRQAIDDGQLTAYYQPKARLSDGVIVGVEALARWPHPDYGFIPPDEFIPLAEQSGLIAPLTEFVLHEALVQQREWADRGLDLTVAVNVSARGLVDRGLPARVQSSLRATGVRPDRLVLEITESTMMADPIRTSATIAELAAVGVAMSIDDFGTGYSSLGHLQRLPVAEVKIDRSFVFPLNMDPGAALLVRSIVDLAHNLGLYVVAEGVEDQLTWDRLAEIGCEQAQGYCLSRPLPASQLTDWLDQRRRARQPVR
jgi:diguanylate cyclase (GGDEF)-like protein